MYDRHGFLVRVGRLAHVHSLESRDHLVGMIAYRSEHVSDILLQLGDVNVAFYSRNADRSAVAGIKTLCPLEVALDCGIGLALFKYGVFDICLS